MKGTLEVLLCAWFVVCGTCLGANILVKKNSLSVTSPKSIRGGYECAIADFGVPEHGGALVGTVVYLKSNRKACKSFSEFDISSEFRPGGLRTFVLVDRGDCYFALKTWHVQASGAAAVLIADDITEPLTNINLPDNGNYLKNITIPSALITKSLGALIKKALSNGEMVNLTLDFTEALPGSPVKYELWTSGIYQCGPNCDALIEFLKSFKAVAQMLEQKGYTQFTPHYTTWYCPPAFVRSRQCRSQCISHGRYCVPTPEMEELNRWYEGKDVMVGNLRQACVFQVAKESRQPWLWWDYVTESATRCPMEEKKYKKGSVDQVIQSLDE